MALNYTVGTIVKRTNITPSGQFVDVYEVNFSTASGVVSSVLIPVTDFTKEKAQQEIEAVVNQLEAVRNL